MANANPKESLHRQMLRDLVPDAEFAGDDPWPAIASPQDARRTNDATPLVDSLRREPNSPQSASATGEFVPLAPVSFAEIGLTASEIEGLVLKSLLSRGVLAGRDIAGQVKLPFPLVTELLREFKNSRLLTYKAEAGVGDYVYEITDHGSQRAGRHAQRGSYFGAAPVSLAAYTAAVRAQTIANERPKLADLRRAFGELTLSPMLFNRLGQALQSSRGLFLHGAAGNGKTSIAERICQTYGRSVWIPRAISVQGEFIRLYDPAIHEVLPGVEPNSVVHPDQIDKRWIRIRRPTVVVGGELTLENLELIANPSAGISEAPIQLKSNCGTLVIDDLGRQQIRPAELLNRWIYPLEKRQDILTLPSGRKISVPFDQLIVFSTNLEPKDLVDDAFLRRIPYKIEVSDPTEVEFIEIFRRAAGEMSIDCPEPPLAYLVERHYKANERPFRFCHARDLLQQVQNFCGFHERRLELTIEAIDAAVENYFAVF